MPTIILLDVSLSMASSISHLNEDQQECTIKDMMIMGIISFLQSLENNLSTFMMDLVALITYSNTLVSVVPFTKDLEKIKKQLVDIKLQNKTNLVDALVAAVQLVQSSKLAYGHAVEILVFTDNSSSLKDNQYILKQLYIPFIHYIHFISIDHISPDLQVNLNQKKHDQITTTTTTTTSDSVKPTNQQQRQQQQQEDSDDQNSITKSITLYNNNLHGTMYIINKEYNNIKSILSNIITNILQSHYSFYRGMITFGHLTSPFTLYPSIYTINSFVKDRFKLPSQDISAASNNSSNNNNLEPIFPNTSFDRFPSHVSIIGFLPSKSLNKVDSVTRHVVIPLIPDSQPGSTPPLCPVLHYTLRAQKKTAIVSIIDKQWYGLLTAVVENDTPVLILTTLAPHSNFSDIVLECGIDQMEVGTLGNFESIQQQQQQQQQQQNQHQQSNLPSYNNILNGGKNLNNLPVIDQSFARLDNIQMDIQKLQRIIRTSPFRIDTLVLECEKIRQTALTYQMPSLMTAILVAIKEELNQSLSTMNISQQHASILQALLYRLELPSAINDELGI
ncbi:hypothetical protein DFA_08202 [Cavenderia fasciculata]|uniref:Integrator complex subunit 14 n=1 Tax=Cavenderia fasciculata TaxID=261658 RepID=F4Q5F6_CACFS|nr:uncharacterized protein DFA_08202 [Cavenderia fasciculata]EGG17215.1 hypothetical protein DFA_08202 [Cavenderia fasciculata]|eukprot:XP_004355699.1 hypothetical protein DFA_08202 [Cavenderia fasciculata]